MSENIGEQYDNIIQIGSGCLRLCHFFIKFKRQSWNNLQYDVRETAPLQYRINLSVDNNLILASSHTFMKSMKHESKSHSSTSHRVW